LDGTVDIRRIDSIAFSSFSRAAALALAERSVYATCCSGSPYSRNINGRPRWGDVCTRCSRSQLTTDALGVLLNEMEAEVAHEDRIARSVEISSAESRRRLDAAREEQAKVIATWENADLVLPLAAEAYATSVMKRFFDQPGGPLVRTMANRWRGRFGVDACVAFREV
jgi:hypothetical protein